MDVSAWGQFLQTIAPTSVILVIAATALLAFARGWIFTAFQVKSLLDARADYKELYERAQSQLDQILPTVKKLVDSVDDVSETLKRVLKALPPLEGDGTKW